MTLRFFILSTFVLVFASFLSVSAQVDNVLAQITDTNIESFAGGLSGNGRFAVFESRANLATENPRNADGNVEIFLFDYAQRRIFQITDTKSVLFNTANPATFNNIRVEITNRRPVISNDGKWIAFSSNATSSTVANPNFTNPGSFDGNALTAPTPVPTPTPSPSPSPSATPTPAANPLTEDANLEMWLYEIPAYSEADLSLGDELPLTNLSGGAFTAVTNTVPSRLPQPGSSTAQASVADDNHDASINNDGNVISFGSTRDLDSNQNPFPTADNDEIFTYTRSTLLVKQITKTVRGPITNPIYNKNSTISGDGQRVVFASTGENPVNFPNISCGANPLASRNEEIFYADLNSGAPTNVCRQITTTTPLNPGDPVNILDLGRRMSRDGRFIAFDSYADLAGTGPGQTSFALYLYDVTANTFRQIGPRSNADTGAGGGDVSHYPGFTDNNADGAPSTLLFESRLNINPSGTVPATAADGLNPEVTRPAQIYSYPLNVPAATAAFTRLTKAPALTTNFVPSTQPLTSDSSKRFIFNLSLTEFGTGNPDLQSEVFYLFTPSETTTAAATLNLFTGASRQVILPSVVGSPSPTPTPTPTPAPTPTPTPGPTPSPSPTPTPVTPAAVLGISPGMLTILNFDIGAVTARTAVGSINRRFELPIELSGVTVTINGAACGLKSVSQTEIVFVSPRFLSSTNAGTLYPIVINNNGAEFKDNVTLVPTRPDIFTNLPAPGPGGRAQAQNVTNRVPTGEPFTVTTVRLRGGSRVPTVLRLRVTGVANTVPSVFSIRIGSTTITGTQIINGGILVEPGVYTIDFLLPPGLNAAGDQPIILSVNAGGTIYNSRLDDTAPRLSFL